MPLISVEHNIDPNQFEANPLLLTNLSAETAKLLGKPEQYVMARLQYNPELIFAGSNRPTAYVQLKSLGLPEDKTTDLSASICSLLSQQLNVPADRVYIEFSSPARHMWGWNGGTF